MSLSTVYLQHRLQLLERHFSIVLQMMKLSRPSDADDLADLERTWLAECEESHAAFLRGDSH
jgi:hypothetical protein